METSSFNDVYERHQRLRVINACRPSGSRRRNFKAAGNAINRRIWLGPLSPTPPLIVARAQDREIVLAVVEGLDLPTGQFANRISRQ
jgi:hypothetical protein